MEARATRRFAKNRESYRGKIGFRQKCVIEYGNRSSNIHPSVGVGIMNSSSNRASSPSGKSRRKEVSHEIETANKMLPLVRSIVTDIVGATQQITQLTPEQLTLEEYRRSLQWASRERRYALHDQIAAAEKTRTQAVHELDELGVALVDANVGQVDFPTRINGRPAAYSWQLGEETLNFWHYSGEELRRPIPSEWLRNSRNP
jgi:hypothetical protein